MNLMKRLMAVSAAVLLSGTAVFAGSSGIYIQPPHVSTGNGTVDAQLNTQIDSAFAPSIAEINKYFAKYHDQTDLARGFANAGAATRDNASMMGFQNYDLFCVMLGANFGVSYPANSVSGSQQAFEDILDKGDVYTGLGSGGIAGQVGINASFLIDNLFLSAKFGTFSFNRKFGDTKVELNQYMLGVGANYRVISSWDFLFGLAKWRGISLGSGLVYNSSSAKVTLPIADQSTGNFNVSYLTYSYDLSGSVTNIGARLSIDSSSLVIPLEATTSVQFLWLFNLGLGAGVDIIIPSSSIKLGGGATTNLEDNGGSGVTMTPGKVTIVGTDSENKLKFTDVVAPRLAADLGFNISVVKIDIPISWYPFTKAVAIGASAGVAW